jgi:plasmid stabilization system protein ParE
LKKIVFLAGAKADLDEAMAFLERKRKGQGIALLARFHEALPRIQQFPSAARFLFKPFRRVPLKPFSYGIIYSVEEHEISIIAVTHDRRDPDHWKHRI